MTGVTPRCPALVLCDSVWRDPISGRVTLVGVLQAFEVDSFPANTPPFSVWLQVTDGNGRLAIQLVLQYLPTDSLDAETIVAVSLSLNFDDPNAVREHVSRFEAGIALKSEGRYRMLLTADDTTIQLRDFVARTK